MQLESKSISLRVGIDQKIFIPQNDNMKKSFENEFLEHTFYLFHIPKHRLWSSFMPEGEEYVPFAQLTRSMFLQKLFKLVVYFFYKDNSKQ